MANTKLIFESPTYLNSLAESVKAEPKQWMTIDGEELEINTDTWSIASDSGVMNEPITDWWVNESEYLMTIEANTPGFEPLSQQFAVAMVGQLFPMQLVQYIASINKVYAEMQDNQDSPQPDSPENAPSPEPQDLPTPNDEQPPSAEDDV